MGRKNKGFGRLQRIENAYLNNVTYQHYLLRLVNIACSVYGYRNMPDTINVGWMERTLIYRGMCLLFRDPVIGDLALPCAAGGKMNVYNVPTRRQVATASGYTFRGNSYNSVVCFNDNTRLPMVNELSMYAYRLTKVQRAIDININGQKTPILVTAPESQVDTVQNMYAAYDGNQYLMVGVDDMQLPKWQVLQTGVPFVADKLTDLKHELWNEALSYIGVLNLNLTKKARVLSGEVEASLGGTVSTRYSRLEARQMAWDRYNKMFGTNVEVFFKDSTQGEEAVDEGGAERYNSNEEAEE